jgi:transposase
VSSTRDPHGAESPRSQPDSELAKLRKEVDELKIVLGRSASRIHKLEAELDTTRSQVAWFHRQLFGQKAERVRPEDLESAWHAFLKEQEASVRGSASGSIPEITELSSVQLLLGFVDPTRLDQPASALEQMHPDAEEGLPSAAGAESPPASTKKKGHGRNRVPPTLREETIIIEPDHVPDGARRVGAEIAYRVGIRRAEMVRYAIVRPKYARDDEDETSTKITIAEPPHEMIPRGVLAPSGLAHVIASKFDRHVPYHRLQRFFVESGYRLPVSTLSGVAIRAAPLATTLVDAMKAHAQQVAPYLAIDATGALLQRPERCLRGHVWLRYVEDVCVLVSFTKTSIRWRFRSATLKQGLVPASHLKPEFRIRLLANLGGTCNEKVAPSQAA